MFQVEFDMSDYDDEVNILFEAICDGVRQEVRYRYLQELLAPKDDMRLTEERERGLISSLAFYIRTSGFMVHVEHYWYADDNISNAEIPDLAIRLPRIGKYLFLEAKPINPGYSAIDIAREDLEKLSRPTNPNNKRNGFIAIGFAKSNTRHETFKNKYNELSKYITTNYQFREFRLESVELENVGDPELKYAIVGLWLRKLR